MNKLLLTVLLLVGLSCARLSEQQYRFLFQKWTEEHQKTYTNAESNYRFNVWKKNLDLIMNHNSKGKSYTLAMNKFGDMTHEEFTALYLTPVNAPEEDFAEMYSANGVAPKTQDWRKSGAVTPVKNQGQCGSCFSFSTTGTLEGAWKLAGHSLVSLSEQQIVDCSKPWGNDGCHGGTVSESLRYIKDVGGVDTEKAYPYMATVGTCKFSKAGVAATVSGMYNITQGSEADLMNAVGTRGPVGVAIDASHQSFQFYSSGIYDEPKCSSTKLDHAILAVGYNQQGTQPYWIVKNSWGTSWGQEGYLWMIKDDNNHCGIATQATLAIVA